MDMQDDWRGEDLIRVPRASEYEAREKKRFGTSRDKAVKLRRAKVRTHAQSGMTAPQIAAILKISDAMVHKDLSAMGIKLREIRRG